MPLFRRRPVANASGTNASGTNEHSSNQLGLNPTGANALRPNQSDPSASGGDGSGAGPSMAASAFDAGAPASGPIAAFWAWWPVVRSRMEVAVESRQFDLLVPEILERVDAIHPKLAWELSPGVGSRYAFCLSSEGDIEVRQFGERWLARAPASDETWEFHAARIGRGPGLFVLEGIQINQALYRIAAELNSRQKLDVRLYHPDQRRLTDRGGVTSAVIFLDHLLGEDDVERWIGRIETADEELPGMVGPSVLRDLIDRLRNVPPHGTYALMQGQANGQPYWANVDLAVKRIDHIFDDVHGRIDIAIEPCRHARASSSRSTRPRTS